MAFRAGFYMVLYNKETTWSGSLNERWGISYTIWTINYYSYYFQCKYVDIFHSKNLVSIDTWYRSPDRNIIIIAILGPHGLNEVGQSTVSRIFVTHGSVLIFCHAFVKTYVGKWKDSNICKFVYVHQKWKKIYSDRLFGLEASADQNSTDIVNSGVE